MLDFHHAQQAVGMTDCALHDRLSVICNQGKSIGPVLLSTDDATCTRQYMSITSQIANSIDKLMTIDKTVPRSNPCPPLLEIRHNSPVMKILASVALWLPAAAGISNKPALRYKTCGDLSQQINSHVSAISRAVRNGQDVAIVDAFVVDENVKSAVPLSTVVDTSYLVERIWDLGIDAKVVQPDITTLESIPCYEQEDDVPEAGEVVSAILRAIRPSDQLKIFSDSITDGIETIGLDFSEGVCLHRPSGAKCTRYGADGIHQLGNCPSESGQTFMQSLQSRVLTSGKRWVYYVGEVDAPQELAKSNHKVVTKFDLIEKKLMLSIQSRFPSFPFRSMENIWSLIDAVVCRSLPYFAGNSANDWSAIQIALHQLDAKPASGAYWYNSQSIALAEKFLIYHIPIVYTYTELSAGAGKHLMKASLTSVKAHMPRSQIHVIYHGNDDLEFRSWLTKKGVIIHQHNPTWRSSVETMRKNGDPMRSHLFLHEGSYFGTWQRIDIPKFIDSEYCLLLDADTIVVKPFTMEDFGRNITKGLAFSAEADPYLILPWNAGISLMNVPFLRESHTKFIEFILQHVNGEPYDPDAPSDQGAYLDFYKGHVDFLSIDFNFKPYFQVKPFEAARKKILHFHGPKPHHYIGHFMGLPCDAAAQSLCDVAGTSPFLCDTVSEFAKNLLRSGEDGPEAYCSGVYHGESTRAELCSFLLERLGKQEGRCTSLSHELQEAQHDFDMAHPQKVKTYQDPGVGEYRYNVCNGLSNQVSQLFVQC